MRAKCSTENFNHAEAEESDKLPSGPLVHQISDNCTYYIPVSSSSISQPTANTGINQGH